MPPGVRSSKATASAGAGPTSVPPAPRLPNLDSGPSSTAPTNPLPTNPIPLIAETVVATSSATAPAQPQFYIKNGDEVRTLGAEQIRLEVATKVIHPESLICKVGDTQWRTLADAGALGLELPPFESPASGIVSKPETLRPVAAKFASDPFARPSLKDRLARTKNKGTIAVWLISLGISSTIVLQRNGTFRSMAESWGVKDAYVSFEKDVFGGPGVGTPVQAEERFQGLFERAPMPFSEVEARVSGKARGSQPSSD